MPQDGLLRRQYNSSTTGATPASAQMLISSALQRENLNLELNRTSIAYAAAGKSHQRQNLDVVAVSLIPSGRSRSRVARDEPMRVNGPGRTTPKTGFSDDRGVLPRSRIAIQLAARCSSTRDPTTGELHDLSHARRRPPQHHHPPPPRPLSLLPSQPTSRVIASSNLCTNSSPPHPRQYLLR